MNKIAQEKIAEEYYALGLQLAMQNAGLTKEAMSLPGKLGLGGLGLAGGGALALNAHNLPLVGKSALAQMIAQKAGQGDEALMRLLGIGG